MELKNRAIATKVVLVRGGWRRGGEEEEVNVPCRFQSEDGLSFILDYWTG